MLVAAAGMAVLLTGSFFASGQAHAQSGSRICGVMANSEEKDQAGKPYATLILFYEVENTHNMCQAAWDHGLGPKPDWFPWKPVQQGNIGSNDGGLACETFVKDTLHGKAYWADGFEFYPSSVGLPSGRDVGVTQGDICLSMTRSGGSKDLKPYWLYKDDSPTSPTEGWQLFRG